jgi:hypothetical protein
MNTAEGRSIRTKRHAPPTDYGSPRPYTPYIASWSEERDVPTSLFERPGLGIAYVDEAVWDRDSHGVLWPEHMADVTIVAFDDPRIRWFRAAKLVRELHDCTLVEVEALCRN